MQRCGRTSGIETPALVEEVFISLKVLKGIALGMVLGSVFQFGSCLGTDWWRLGLWTTAAYTSLEYVLDNDEVLDLFESGATQISG